MIVIILILKNIVLSAIPNYITIWQRKIEGIPTDREIAIFSSLSPFVESDSGAWTLSHELSHFALHEKKYSQSVFIDWVHQKQTEANTCLKNDLSLNNCPDLWTAVKSPLGKNIKMMKIYTSESESEPTSELDKLLAEMNNPTSQSLQASQSLETSGVDCFSDYMSKEFTAAISCYTIFLIINPDDTDAMSWLGRSYEGQSEYNKALNTFFRINKLEPNNVNGLSGIARNYNSLDQCEKAIPYYEKTLLIEPDHIEAKIFTSLSSSVCPNFSISDTTVGSKVFDIKPIISNGFITNYEINSRQDKLKLDITMDSNQSGDAQIVLPRELLDSKSSGNDIPFKVSVGGKFVLVDEIATTNLERVIKFPVSSNARSIIITGSESYFNAVVVPEFSIMVLPILAISILLIVAMTRKYPMNFKF